MFNSKKCLRTMVGLALLTSLGFTLPASAEGFDTSGVQVDQSLAARLPGKIKAAGVITIGSDTAYAPWEYLSEADGQTPVGIDVDIAHAIGAKLGVKIDYQTSAFDAILPALGSKFDLGISAFTITNERMKAVNFVSYFDSGSLWTVKAGNPAKFDPADYCGRKIALVTGAWEETVVAEENEACKTAGKPEIEVLPFATQTEALTRVAAGGADATVTGSSTMGYAVKQSNGRLETMVAPKGKFSERGANGIAVAKADMELTQLIADTVNQLIADGTYQALFDHWGVGMEVVKKAEVNPVVKD
ncbi:MAG: ABC transporter substrate-binding protein [Rhizobium sp.]|nr:ABC transporter substrate-binding protein [Rhizobium sp.]